MRRCVGILAALALSPCFASAGPVSLYVFATASGSIGGIPFSDGEIEIIAGAEGRDIVTPAPGVQRVAGGASIAVGTTTPVRALILPPVFLFADNHGQVAGVGFGDSLTGGPTILGVRSPDLATFRLNGDNPPARGEAVFSPGVPVRVLLEFPTFVQEGDLILTDARDGSLIGGRVEFVPEPSGLALAAACLGGLALRGWRGRRAARRPG